MVKDKLDQKIIKLLKSNSRFSYAQIGREIGLSSSAVGERIQRLEETDVIEFYTTIVNYEKLGYTLSTYISMRFKTVDRFFHFLKLIGDFSEILECSRITGENCLIMKVIIYDHHHLEDFIDILSQYGTPSTSVILSDIVKEGIVIKKNIERHHI
ncbi:Lrp/AsnC family leucine-responsive transcriptional regulator [Aquimarina sp. EL_43]|uniref:Lrp/AsnC family transcriptional regulator n=1 Tax=unclassified Aquimarina TaxID=2627091 RepID=UPI0018CA1314|nr:MULTISPECIES: Lrp/AsnC family transcriptional regulator [unclassified Aquimarina]MBG6130660.1 Lrp/AsnC family leucine-responsive transcriptional regulator [Aquimarina sp. EL_35]MBG6151194.1 Lrp/AsnC family leucine-responsive transcriptional regulator [Aquimarina sp. EL_32]MBG6169062.1 Lrp/AsnC family leucine-responsive transcriptional regulator [Aquimarina sp. EL_43]